MCLSWESIRSCTSGERMWDVSSVHSDPNQEKLSFPFCAEFNPGWPQASDVCLQGGKEDAETHLSMFFLGASVKQSCCRLTEPWFCRTVAWLCWGWPTVLSPSLGCLWSSLGLWGTGGLGKPSPGHWLLLKLSLTIRISPFYG